MRAGRALIDRQGFNVNTAHMDVEDYQPRKADDALAQLTKQDLDPLSVSELEARITALEGEIARARARIEQAGRHRHSAEALFRK